MERYMLVYDADCGPCTKFKQVVDWLDKYNRLSYISLVDADHRGLLDSLPRTRRHKSFHLISPREKVSSGANAIPKLLALLPLGGLASSLILLFPPGKQIVDFVYSTFARLHDTGSCSYKRDSITSFTDREKLSAIDKKKKGDEIRDYLHRFDPNKSRTSSASFDGLIESCFK